MCVCVCVCVCVCLISGRRRCALHLEARESSPWNRDTFSVSLSHALTHSLSLTHSLTNTHAGIHMQTYTQRHAHADAQYSAVWFMVKYAARSTPHTRSLHS